MNGQGSKGNEGWWRTGLAAVFLLIGICVIPAHALVAIRHSGGPAAVAPAGSHPAPAAPTAAVTEVAPESAASGDASATPAAGATAASPLARLEHASERIAEGIHRFGRRIAQLPESHAAPTGEPETSAEPQTDAPLTQEISLQETLDRLGYTVNVPTSYAGHRLFQWTDGYRTSSRDDAVEAGLFTASGTVSFKMLGQQGSLGPHTGFGIQTGDTERVSLLDAPGNGSGFWLDPDRGASASHSATGPVRLYAEVRDASGQFGSGVYTTGSSTDASRLMVLPALKGGHWVDESGNQGHWEGGTPTGGYLTCLEDWNDYDYQDDVVLIKGIRPAS